jgi:hypothetical protein
MNVLVCLLFTQSFDEDEGGRDTQEETFGAHHVLVLIDSRPPMFVKSIPVEGSYS